MLTRSLTLSSVTSRVSSVTSKAVDLAASRAGAVALLALLPWLAAAPRAAAADPKVAAAAPRALVARQARELAEPRAAVAQPAPPAPAVSSGASRAASERWPGRVAGRVLGPDGAPLAGVMVSADGREVQAGADGQFALESVSPDASVVVRLPGYAKARPAPSRQPLEVRLARHAVRGAYLSYYGVSSKQIRDRVLDLIDRTELNAVVIDAKGDRGWIPYRTEVPLALAAGAQGPVLLKDFDELLAALRARGIYTIARIVVMKDTLLAQHRPDLAVIDTRTGKPWIDREKLAWVDPFREEVWAYNLALAKEAIRKGFDEIQFDYVRFPTDGKLAAARYSRPNTRETRLAAITAFLARARRELGPLGAFVAADVFGYTAFNDNDTDIGQRIEEFAPHVDFFSPMVYPSGYHVGIPGYRNPMKHPYQIVYESVRLTRQRAVQHPAQVRPWLQDFRDYAFEKRLLTPAEVRAQIKGAEDAGSSGWMLWNPRNVYSAEALRPRAAAAAR